MAVDGVCQNVCSTVSQLFVIANGACAACDSNCSSCEGSPSHCLRCLNGFVLTGNTCGCPAGTHVTVGTGPTLCVQCDANCKTCSGTATNCDSCETANQLTLLGTLPSRYCGCNDGFSMHTTPNLCQPCSGFCKTCSGNAGNCDSCYTGNGMNLLGITPSRSCGCLDGYS